MKNRSVAPEPMKQPPALQLISATERDGKPLWRVQLKRQGKTRQKRFYHHLHGGEAQALVAAQQWRDQVLAEHPPYSKLDHARKHRSNNSSGRAGVYLLTMKRMRNGRLAIHQLWQARTPEGVTPMRTRNFSVRKYGNELAFRLAVAAREGFEQELALPASANCGSAVYAAY
ncbi:hypothetical protein R0381_002637 [Jeongeupia wiesaeckerbachi]|uniref:hypothetical protein n=1 Tax=Jeongeupia wiesaeckerbachi TaxID=3051218 RepID=UPI003D807A5B